jgi:hypothetical protein
MSSSEQPALLVLGILPSEKTYDDWRAAAASRRSQRRTMLAPPQPEGFAYRFVLSSRLSMPPSLGRRRHRRLARGTASASAESPLQRQQAIEREQRVHGNDLALLDMPHGSLCSCSELVHAWFTFALERWPAARFFAKTEDDIFIALPRLFFDLLRLPAHLPLWYGLFVWTGSTYDTAATKPVGCWGGAFEDNPAMTGKGMRATLGKERGCPDGARPLAPAPTHELDLRSRPLAQALARCSYPGAWLRFASSGGPARLRRCPNDCAAVQGAWLTRCAASHANVTLAHATWTKIHSHSVDNGWRPFAPPSNLTVVLDMNLGDKKVRQDVRGAWDHAQAVLGGAKHAPAFPPLLYDFDPRRPSGALPTVTPLNPKVAEMHAEVCRWGGCHPSRGEASPIWPGWAKSKPWPKVGDHRGDARLGGV